ncbi:MAG: hypothetical protein AB1324_06000 [Candidatus Micrarchaeota archaeon]
MFDIIRCEADPRSFGFERFYSYDSVKDRIVSCPTVVDAEKHKNRKTLITLGDFAFDEGAMKLIAEKKSACILIDLGRLMRSRGVPRAIAFSKLRTFLAMCNRFGVFYSFATFAENQNQIRNTDELQHIAMLLGINRGQAKFALKMLKEYL